MKKNSRTYRLLSMTLRTSSNTPLSELDNTQIDLPENSHTSNGDNQQKLQSLEVSAIPTVGEDTEEVLRLTTESVDRPLDTRHGDFGNESDIRVSPVAMTSNQESEQTPLSELDNTQIDLPENSHTSNGDNQQKLQSLEVSAIPTVGEDTEEVLRLTTESVDRPLDTRHGDFGNESDIRVSPVAMTSNQESEQIGPNTTPILTPDRDFSAASSDEWSPSILENWRRNRTSSSSDDVPPRRINLTSAPSSDVEVPLNSLLPTSNNKRKKGNGPMQRNLRKSRSEKRRKGVGYTTSKGKVISPRFQKPLLEVCRSKCKTKLTGVDLQAFYNDYRNLPTRDAQKQYLAGMIIIKNKQRERKNSETEITKNRGISVSYKFDLNGNLIDLCKSCFCNIYGERSGFINYIVIKKKKSNSNIVMPDTRGQHPPANKRNDDDIAFVNSHIQSFPCYESHYSRKNTQKKYLGSELNLEKMYKLYNEKLKSDKPENISETPVSISLYRKQFQNHNLKFKKPALDTCKTCDAFVMKIKSCTNETEKNCLKASYAEHQDKADFHYAYKRNDKINSKASNGKIIVASFDLQKCLETPCLNTSVSFYKRKLWTFNLTVRDCTNNKTHCFMWHEGTAQRGANEISSCLFKFIMSLCNTVEILILYSDTCPGQNRNSILPAMFMYAIKQKANLKEIHHKFLVPGHTHLECDTDHAAIERFHKGHNSVLSIPQDWMNLVRMTSLNYTVYSMNQSDFLAFSSLFGNVLVKRNTDSERQQFNWNKIFWVMISQDFGVLHFKYMLNDQEPFRLCSLQRRGRNNVQQIELPKAYSEPLKIENKKYKDILDLLQFLDPIYHEFYLNLRHDNRSVTAVSDSDEHYDSSEE